MSNPGSNIRLGFTRTSDLMSQLPQRYQDKYQKGIGIAKPRIVPTTRNALIDSRGRGFGGGGRIGQLDGITYMTLEDAFGYPPDGVSPDEKVQIQWYLRMPSGNILTVYDYKSNRDVREVENWSIGGNGDQRDIAVLNEYLQHYPEDSPDYQAG